MERKYYIEVNDIRKLQVKPFGVFSKVFELLFRFVKSLGYEEIKIEVYVEDDGEGLATSDNTTDTKKE